MAHYGNLPFPPSAGVTTQSSAPPARGSPATVATTATPALAVPILEALPRELTIPSLFVLAAASVSLTLCNALFNVLAQREGHGGEGVVGTFRRWSRVLWMSKAAYIVEAPTAAEAHRLTHDRHSVAVTAQTSPVMSPVEMYDSAAFFRGIAAPPRPHSAAYADGGGVELTEFSTPAPRSHAASRLPTPQPEMPPYHVENPPAAVPAPVVAEALTDTMEAVRLESQRVIFRFHPYYIILCCVKSCVMLLYIQYHFDAIDGGWRRLCVCGAANILSGLLTPVWEYLNVLLLPLDPDRTHPAVVKVDEEKTDSVFIVEVLLRIGSLELDDLPTVLMQGSSFVAFAAVLVPLLIVFCLPGVMRYLWLYVPLWLVYVLVRHLYYRGANMLPSSTARNAAAVVGMTSEVLKALLLKSLTFFVVLVTVQSSFLLGLAWAEGLSYDGALQYAVHNEVVLWHSGTASTFQTLCLLSQLFL